MQVKRDRKSEPGDADEPSKTDGENTGRHTQERYTNTTHVCRDKGWESRQRQEVKSKTRHVRM